jgi:hypothetical protein
MSGKNTDLIRKKLDSLLAGAAATTKYGTVISTDEEKRTCTVKIGEINYDDVLLYAVEKPDLKGLVYLPKVQSTVLVSRVDGSDRFYVSLFSVVDKILFTHDDKTGFSVSGEAVELKADQSLLKITKAGFTLKRNSSGLKKTLSDILTALQQLTVPTGVGPSGVPINSAQFSQIQQDLENYM